MLMAERVRSFSAPAIATLVLAGFFGASVKAQDNPGDLAPSVTDADGCFTQAGAMEDNGKWLNNLPSGQLSGHNHTHRAEAFLS
jgi:hypothetical protein